MTVRTLGRPALCAAVCISVLGLAACGESSQEKATKQVCSAASEINTQLDKLKGLTISQAFLSEAQTSVEAINKSVTKIKEAAPNLPEARKQEIEAADKKLQAELATMTKSFISAAKSSTNLEAALKAAEPQIRTAINNLAASYKKAYEQLKCS